MNHTPLDPLHAGLHYYHVFWTRPYFRPDQSTHEDIVLWDFELLIWLLSALQVGRFGPLRLVTDTRGALATERAGLAPFYRGGISSALDKIPASLNSDIFWAGGKLYAYGLMEAPWVCVDQDAVLWKPLSLAGPVMALHRESRQWGWYSQNRTAYERFGFGGPEWRWDVDPFNTGVLFIADPRVAEDYSRTACAFAEAYSGERAGSSGAMPQDRETMLFAEQRLLSMCAARTGIEVLPITDTQPMSVCLPKNPDCLHLWRTKLAYKICAEARTAFVNWAIGFLLKHFPESRPVLSKWKLDKPREASPAPKVDPADFRDLHRTDVRFSLLKNVRGTITVHDLATGITRPGSEGAMIWSGDLIRPEPEAQFNLQVIGSETIQVSAAAD